MPLVEVTYDPAVEPARLFALAERLPGAVSIAVECPEEPFDGVLQPGDVEVRFRARGAYDFGGLDIVVEVRSKWFASRAGTHQERCDRLRDSIVEAVGGGTVGVYMSLPVAAWSQSE